MNDHGYPIIDAGNGRSLNGLIKGWMARSENCDAKTRVIPGHGVISGIADLRAYHDMPVAMRQRVPELVEKHQSVEPKNGWGEIRLLEARLARFGALILLYR